MNRRPYGWLETLVLLMVAIGCPTGALAQPGEGPVILWMSDAPEGAERAAALAVEVAPRSASVVLMPAPPGDAQAHRAITARGAARASGADVSLWVERDADGSRSIRAVTASRELTAWAPIPPRAGDPRLVALIAASVLDELLAVPEPRVEITLNARLELGSPAPRRELGERFAGSLHYGPAEPRGELSDPMSVVWDDDRASYEQRRDFYLEIGPSTAGVANGGLIGVGLYPHRNIRLDVITRLVHVIPTDSFASAFTTSAAFVTDDDDGRFEVGLSVGLSVVTSQTRSSLGRGPICIAPCADELSSEVGFLVGSYAGFSWGPWDDVRLGFRAHIDLSVLDGDVYPAPIADLYVQVMP